MKLWQDLFGTDYGRMSIAGIIFMLLMAIWFVRFFITKSAPPPVDDLIERDLQRLRSKRRKP